jgi:hypothetical protein
MANRLLLNTDDFVRVVQTTGEPIVGRYDGVNYDFPDAQTEVNEGGLGYRDVHKDVALHIFGFGLPQDVGDDQNRIDKKSALLRLGWITGDSSSVAVAMKKLINHVKFLDIPPFPVSTLKFEKPADESVARVPSPTMGHEGGAATTPVSPAALTDPFQQAATPPKVKSK